MHNNSVIELDRLTMLPRPIRCPWCSDRVYLAFEEVAGQGHLVDPEPRSEGRLVLRIAVLERSLRLCRGMAWAAGAPIFVVQQYDERLHGDRSRYVSHFSRCRASRYLMKGLSKL